MSPKQAAAWLRKQQVRFDCDCLHHRFGGFRYIATISDYALQQPFARLEPSYPKIKDPTLRGVACKHTLRVMAEIESSNGILNYLVRMIEKARAADSAAIKLQEAEELARKQAKRSRDIKTSSMRQAGYLHSDWRRFGIAGSTKHGIPTQA